MHGDPVSRETPKGSDLYQECSYISLHQHRFSVLSSVFLYFYLGTSGSCAGIWYAVLKGQKYYVFNDCEGELLVVFQVAYAKKHPEVLNIPHVPRKNDILKNVIVPL